MVYIIGQKSKEVDSDKQAPRDKFTGYRFIKAESMYGEEKCIYCGKWFQWRNVPTPHCGNSACEYFHHRRMKHQELQARETEANYFRMFDKLKRMKLVH